MSVDFSDLTPPYRTIVADPPWSYRQTGVQGAVAKQYSTLTDSEIAGLPVVDLAAADAHLYMWVTVPKLWDSPNPAEIAEAWGFTYKTLLTWVKGEKVGLGWYYRVDCEHVLFATRGKAPIPGPLRESSVLYAPRKHHSAKPSAFLERIERVSPGPYLELFSRDPALGWDSWGHGYEIGGAA
jgi:N6-adenosine-specific RNA methylase IME4